MYTLIIEKKTKQIYQNIIFFRNCILNTQRSSNRLPIHLQKQYVSFSACKRVRRIRCYGVIRPFPCFEVARYQVHNNVIIIYEWKKKKKRKSHFIYVHAAVTIIPRARVRVNKRPLISSGTAQSVVLYFWNIIISPSGHDIFHLHILPAGRERLKNYRRFYFLPTLSYPTFSYLMHTNLIIIRKNVKNVSECIIILWLIFCCVSRKKIIYFRSLPSWPQCVTQTLYTIRVRCKNNINNKNS